jgi:hypothetical protein
VGGVSRPGRAAVRSLRVLNATANATSTHGPPESGQRPEQDEIRALRRASRKLEESSGDVRRDIRDLGRQVESLRSDIVAMGEDLHHHGHEPIEVDGIGGTTLLTTLEQMSMRLEELGYRLGELET